MLIVFEGGIDDWLHVFDTDLNALLSRNIWLVLPIVLFVLLLNVLFYFWFFLVSFLLFHFLVIFVLIIVLIYDKAVSRWVAHKVLLVQLLDG